MGLLLAMALLKVSFETAAMPTRESDMRWRILLSDSKEMLNVAPTVVGISLATGNDINVAVSR